MSKEQHDNDAIEASRSIPLLDSGLAVEREAEWRPLEPGETHGFQLKPRIWSDRLKIAFILCSVIWILLTRGEASMKVTRGKGI